MRLNPALEACAWMAGTCFAVKLTDNLTDGLQYHDLIVTVPPAFIALAALIRRLGSPEDRKAACPACGVVL